MHRDEPPPTIPTTPVKPAQKPGQVPYVPNGSTRLKKLTDLHRRAAEIMIKTGSCQEAAKEVGVHVLTVYHWKRNPSFRRMLDRMRREAWDESVQLLQGNAQAAIGRLLLFLNLPMENEYKLNDAGEIEYDEKGKPVLLKQGYPELVLQAIRIIIETNMKWLHDDVAARVEKLERHLQKQQRDIEQEFVDVEAQPAEKTGEAGSPLAAESSSQA